MLTTALSKVLHWCCCSEGTLKKKFLFFGIKKGFSCVFENHKKPLYFLQFMAAVLPIKRYLVFMVIPDVFNGACLSNIARCFSTSRLIF